MDATKSKSTSSYQIAFDYLGLNNISTFYHSEEKTFKVFHYWYFFSEE